MRGILRFLVRVLGRLVRFEGKLHGPLGMFVSRQVILFALLFAIRSGIEERALIAGLPGYADYTTQVRYRLVPGLW